MHTTTAQIAPAKPRVSYRWRVVDIVVASVIGVASGLIFLLWNVGYQVPGKALEAALPGLQGLMNGPWLFAGVLTALVIRKPGAALFGELLAAIVSALVGNVWGPLTIVSGLVQGLGAELVILAFLYTNYRLYVAILAGAAAGLFNALNDLIWWYPGSAGTFIVSYIGSSVLSGAVIAGVLSWLIAKGLAKTGALNRFASGREATAEV